MKVNFENDEKVDVQNLDIIVRRGPLTLIDTGVVDTDFN